MADHAVFKLLSAVFLVLGVTFSAWAAPPRNAPKVAVSIKPLHSLIAGVMEGLGTPSLIIKGTASPHAFVLKPSDAATLNRAHLTFWVGPGLEASLSKALEALSGRAYVIGLAATTMMGLPPKPSEGELHFWLDPGKARAVVAIAVAQLGALDPTNAFQYRANGQRVSLRIDYLERLLFNKLSPLRNIPFLVYHNAYGHLARAYNLKMVGAVATHPETPPSARRMSELRKIIDQGGVRCLFQEPQFNSRPGYALIDGTNVRTGFLDPMGGALDPGPDLYFQMMEINAESLSNCLGK